MKIIRIKGRSGMVLVMVLMAIIVMSIFVVSILSQSLNQGTSSQAQVDRIKAQQLAKGLFWKSHSDMIASVVPADSSETLNGKTFTIDVDAAADASTKLYTVNVTY